jgi:UPF0716 protein FxsA
MWAKLLLVFTIVPIIELTLLITLGDKIGLQPTLAIVITTALLGATLGKLQGTRAWRRIKQDLATGQLPQDSLLDGLAVLIASAFLVTPGVLTDIAAFTLLTPFTRAPIKKLVRKRVEKWLGFDGSSPAGMMGFGMGFDPYEGAEDEDEMPPEGFHYAQGPRTDDIIIEPMETEARREEKSKPEEVEASAVVIDLASADGRRG